MSVSENLANARMAISHVKKTLWLGSANKVGDYLPGWAGGTSGLNLAGVIAQRTFSPTSVNAGPERVAATAES